MAKFTFFLIYLKLSILSFGQVVLPYYDALALKKIKEKSIRKKISLNETKNILSPYLGNEITIQNLDSNPFFRNNFYEEGANSTITPIQMANVASQVGGLDVTNIADGFARFIVKRTKQELGVAFFEKFKDIISDSAYLDLQTLFPQTHKNLLTIGEDIYNYSIYLQVIKAGFEKDLSSLPQNLPYILENHPAYFEKNKDLKWMLTDAFYISTQIKNFDHPGNIIENYNTKKEKLASNNTDYYNGIKALKIISNSLKSNSSQEKYWISATEFNELKNDTVLFNIYMGLLYEQFKKENIKFGKSQTPFHTLLSPSENASYFDVISYFSTKSQLIDNEIHKSKNIANDSLKIEKYSLLVNEIIGLHKTIHKIGNLTAFATIPELTLKKNFSDYIELAQLSCNISSEVNRKNYHAAIINTALLFNKIYPQNEEIDLIDSRKKISTTKIKSSILKYGNFAALMTSAKTSKDVADIIETVALPSGSSRIKRETNFNVSLNAYAGFFGGYEYIKGVNKGSVELNSFGISAPIGIAISSGRNKFLFMPCKKSGHWSYSLMFSAIDLGAVTAFRFSNDSAQSVPKIELKDIISPGVFLSIGIPKSPLSINMGYQVGPLLREVTIQGNNYAQNYSRFSVALCMDLPLLNLYTNSKK